MLSKYYLYSLRVILFILIQYPFLSYSQKFNITGKVTDEITGSPLIMCAVRLISDNNSLLGGTISDSLGNFQLSASSKGEYVCVLNYIGYSEKKINVSVKSKKTDLGAIQIQPKSKQLNEIQVNASQKNKSLVDRFVFTVDSADLAKAVTSLDVMRKIPDLDVSDINKSISIKGKGSSLILINGVNRGGAINLLSINPADIEKVELIYNPSSEYESEVDGVINIILKNNPTSGSSGEFDLSYRTIYRAAEPAFVYQYGTKRTRFSVNYYPSFKSIPVETELSRVTKISDTLSYKYGSKYNSNDRFELTNRLQGSLDFYINEKNFLNLYIETNLTNSDYKNKLESHSLGLDSVYINSLSTSKTFYNVNNATLYYKKNFDKQGQEFTINNNFNYLIADYKNLFSDTISSSLDKLKKNENREIDETGEKIANNLKLDYLHPLNDILKLSTGVLLYFQSFTYTFLSNNQKNSDVLKNLKWHYYLDLSLKIKKINIRAGSKVENNISDLSNNSLKTQFQFLPSLTIFTQLNKENSLRLGYRKTAFYPSAWQYMPNLVYYDYYNATQGNPDLKPVNQDKVEMSHTFRNKSNSLTTSFFYSHLTNMITSVRTVNNQNISIRKIENIDGKSTVGTDISYNFIYNEILNIKPTVKFFREWFSNKSDSRVNYSFNASLSFSYTHKEKTIVGFDIVANGKQLLVQGYDYTEPSIEDIYIQRVIFKGAGAFAIGVMNPFFIEKTKSVVEDYNFNQNYYEKIYSSCFFISFTYNFAKGIELNMKKIDRQTEKDLK